MKTKTKIFVAIISPGLFGGINKSLAMTYYVTPTGSNLSVGTSREMAWQTIGKCASTMVAGDTCVVGEGTYNEIVSPANSGTAQDPINYVAKNGEAVIVRQFLIGNDRYIRIIGFEITHNNTSYCTARAINLYLSDHIEIINNYIHHTCYPGIGNGTSSQHSDYVTIRGNRIVYTGCPLGVAGQCDGANGINLSGSHNLIEYNDISHTLDFINTYGGYNIIRNNYLHHFRNSDFPDGGGDAAHVDTFQPFGVPGEFSDRNIFENNLASDNLEANSHFLQVRDENQSGETEFIIRGNVAMRFGSYVAQLGAIDYTRMYNNTFSDFRNGVGYTNEPPHTTIDVSTNNFNFNNIYYNTNSVKSVDVNCEINASNNACEQSGSDASCLVISNINFLDYANDDFRLSSLSFAKNAGRALTVVTSETGSGHQFSVEDAGFFTDGYGITAGDSIKVGSSGVLVITAIDYDTNMITVDQTTAWNGSDLVRLAYQDEAPDIGAYPFRTENSDLSGTWNKSDSLVIVEPNDSSLVRFVEVFENGIPLGKDFFAPWSVGGVGGGMITVKIYSLFADQNMLVNATQAGSDTISPATPRGLSIK